MLKRIGYEKADGKTIKKVFWNDGAICVLLENEEYFCAFATEGCEIVNDNLDQDIKGDREILQKIEEAQHDQKS
jgi:hypothetical protein